ncbi:hypothetical protein [Aliikangiella sp. G2MR2-5]|uniref:hypothetical protein n=1 Tax=Aliikangiella sp. G2MR2-5 TaxID=2788943 RepID=UPI0018AC5CC3|nr:hypothetical protein [Aliikangiella sp. G2MR2-5]
MTDKTLYLHVGWSKTGTSAVQNAINSNSELFLKKDILYPKSVQWNDHSHHKFALAFNETSGYSSEFTLNDAISAVEKELLESNCQSVLISSELSPFYFDFKEFRNFVDRNFNNVVVIFSLRLQSELILSLFNQLVKDPNVRYPGSIFSLTMANIEWMDYYNTVKKWEAVVGKENIKIFLHSKHIVGDFLDFFTIEKQVRNTKDSKEVNVSVPNQLLPAIKQINVNVVDPVQYKKNLDEVIAQFNSIAELRTPGILYSIPEQRMLDNYYKVSNSKLAKEYFGRNELFEAKQYKPVMFTPLAVLRQLSKLNKAD